eukprot:5921823-Amphidinium_carterae.1
MESCTGINSMLKVLLPVRDVQMLALGHEYSSSSYVTVALRTDAKEKLSMGLADMEASGCCTTTDLDTTFRERAHTSVTSSSMHES